MKKMGYKFVYNNNIFIGVNKFNKKFNFVKVLKYLHVNDLIESEKYSYEGFYEAFSKINYEYDKKDYPDIFECLETGKLYIPGNEKLLIIKKLDKLERMLVNSLS